MMRVMLLANLAVEQRFASGAQGRVTWWSPDVVNPKKAVKASHPDICIRFTKEKALLKHEMFPEIDFMEVIPRSETLLIPGQPVLQQVPLAPSYALTVHKVQSLSMADVVRGCLESVFAYGQLYVLISRVTDPENFQLIGLPPADLLDAVARAWQEAGMSTEECLQRAVGVTKEFEYVNGPDALCDRVRPVHKAERTTQIRHKDLSEILLPQPRATAVYRRLLDWIDRADRASQAPAVSRPAFLTAEGGTIFPDESDTWWLLDMKRKAEENKAQDEQCDEDGPFLHEGAGSDDDAAAMVTDSSADSEKDEPAGDQEVQAGHVAWARTEKQRKQPTHDNGRARNAKTPVMQAAGGLPPDDDPMHGMMMSMQPPGRESYRGHFERQQEARCGMHALNNAIGQPLHNPADMTLACNFYLQAAHQEGSPEARASHYRTGGWYSSEVMAQAVTTTSLTKHNRVEYAMTLEPLHVNPTTLQTSIGAVVNIGNVHWVALRWFEGQVWLLDSREPPPKALSWDEYLSFIRRYRDAYPIAYATNSVDHM